MEWPHAEIGWRQALILLDAFDVVDERLHALGARGLAEGTVELRLRRDGTVRAVPLDRLVEEVALTLARLRDESAATLRPEAVEG